MLVKEGVGNERGGGANCPSRPKQQTEPNKLAVFSVTYVTTLGRMREATVRQASNIIGGLNKPKKCVYGKVVFY